MKLINRFALLLSVAGLLVYLWGCSKDNPVTQTGPTTDEVALQQQVVEADSVADFSSGDEATIDDNGMRDPEYDADVSLEMQGMSEMAKASSDSIYPVRWGRHINHITRNYLVTMDGDSAATVTIMKTLSGVFRVGLGIRTPDTVIVDTVIRKPFVEDVTRKVRFRRIARSDNPRHNWVPVAITLVRGKTNETHDFSIASLEVTSHLVPFDRTVTDPLDTWFRLGRFMGSVPVFPVGDSITVRVTITSSSPMAELVYLRHSVPAGLMERRRARMNVVSTTGGSGTYTRVYERSFHTRLPRRVLAARFNAVADAKSYGSIYSNDAPFSNEFWGMPYIVVR